jgi:rfaE bifunctional protein nucleotidyltransferase chain/domain
VTRKQEILRRKHGTPAQFERSIWKSQSESSSDEAAIAVRKYRAEFEQAARFSERQGSDKIVRRLTDLVTWAKDRKFAKIALVNGCFDILHAGHIDYLRTARAMGDYLVVLLNSDASVRKLKGSGRPINCEADRAEVLSALEMVDLIFIFKETRITRYLGAVKPAVWAKGGDYTLWTLNRDEREAAVRAGSNIAIIPFKRNLSTTKIHEKIATR